MNLFVLSQLVKDAAKMHCDKHCVKMILEATQMLYTSWLYGRNDAIDWDMTITTDPPYKSAYVNHPVTIWVRSFPNHYNWAVCLGLELCKEYTMRYGKTHKCYNHLKRLAKMGFPPKMLDSIVPPIEKRATINCPIGCEYFDCAIADVYFRTCASYTDGKLDCVETYRNYYNAKSIDMRWKTSESPTWYDSTKQIIIIVEQCQAIVSSGKNKGTRCTAKCKFTSSYCGRHRNV
tara:strand:+ start:193 stop:891 length:699 start_codon:yes stop_codon:yes gene_type:complete